MYAPVRDLAVYETLLDLVARTRTGIADLEPADNIDIQSFIWVVDYYRAGDIVGSPASEESAER